MVARWAVKVGYKVMVFEMVPNILGFDQGAIQIALENILREAGYEVTGGSRICRRKEVQRSERDCTQ